MIQIKFFIGIRLSSELRSKASTLVSTLLKKIPYQGKEYLGFHLASSHPPLPEVRKAHFQLMEELMQLFPEQKCDKWPIYLFPETFIG